MNRRGSGKAWAAFIGGLVACVAIGGLVGVKLGTDSGEDNAQSTVIASLGHDAQQLNREAIALSEDIENALADETMDERRDELKARLDSLVSRTSRLESTASKLASRDSALDAASISVAADLATETGTLQRDALEPFEPVIEDPEAPAEQSQAALDEIQGVLEGQQDLLEDLASQQEGAESQTVSTESGTSPEDNPGASTSTVDLDEPLFGGSTAITTTDPQGELTLDYEIESFDMSATDRVILAESERELGFAPQGTVEVKSHLSKEVTFDPSDLWLILFWERVELEESMPDDLELGEIWGSAGLGAGMGCPYIRGDKELCAMAMATLKKPEDETRELEAGDSVSIQLVQGVETLTTSDEDAGDFAAAISDVQPVTLAIVHVGHRVMTDTWGKPKEMCEDDPSVETTWDHGEVLEVVDSVAQQEERDTDEDPEPMAAGLCLEPDESGESEGKAG